MHKVLDSMHNTIGGGVHVLTLSTYEYDLILKKSLCKHVIKDVEIIK